MVSSILDGGIDDNWDSFEKSLYDAGLEEMLRNIQQAYDRYQAAYSELTA